MVAQIDIARRGNVAQAIRAAIEARQWTAGDLHEKLGMKRGATMAYAWLAARAVPGPAIRKKVSKLLEIPEKDLLPQALETAPALERERALVPIGGEARRFNKPTTDVLAFNVNSEGMARIRLDVSMPLENAPPLLRLLLDAGLVIRQPREGVEG